MKQELVRNVKEDPADIRQYFSEINIKLHCCRYWMLSEWECSDMAFPFWRLYHNSISGASVYYKGVQTDLTADRIIIIPPNTAFSTSLSCKPDERHKESIRGKRITNLSAVDTLPDKQMVDHLFVHFNLGLSYDSMQPGVYALPVNPFILSLLQKIKSNTVINPVNYNFFAGLPVHTLIMLLLDQIGYESWQLYKMDKRVLKAHDYIERCIDQKLTNNMFAERYHMAVNSYARLFKENAGVSIQQYIQKKRIEKSLMLLHHSDKSIEEIASACGFVDRQHFSKVFKQVMKMPPVFYRRRLTF
ncbi:MAG: helix-turn-helix transcriptional regulator [Bacteroidales bacterium]|nr:helix-turn-helix transcriptional regulator [Bacteroidales bacterium]